MDRAPAWYVGGDRFESDIQPHFRPVSSSLARASDLYPEGERFEAVTGLHFEDVMKEREKKIEELIAITAKHLPIANQKMAEVNSAGKYYPALLRVSEVESSGVFV